MIRALRSEFRKLTYVRSTWWLLIVAILFAVLSTVSTAYSADITKALGFPGLDTREGVLNVQSNALASYVFALILGILLAANEFRHNTAIATYLAQPDRRIVLLAKIIVAAIAGALVQLVSTVLALVSGVLSVASFDGAALPASDYLRLIGVAVLSGVVLAVVGVAVGTLIRNQIVAVVGAVMWLFLVEPLITVFAEWIGKWLISGAIFGMLALSIETDLLSFGQELLAPWAATVVLVAYGVVFGVVAVMTTLRRDID